MIYICYIIKLILKGEISLDDLTLKDGYCETNGLFNCDFESDSCGFTNDLASKYSWLRVSGKYASSFTATGPNEDKTVK